MTKTVKPQATSANARSDEAGRKPTGEPGGPRPALVANKLRAMELQSGLPAKKGNKRGPAYAYNVKALRDREIELARHAERAYERFVSHWQLRRPKGGRTGAAKEERR